MQNEPEDAYEQFAIGESYEKGLGVPLDYIQAASWYQKAAEQGLDCAQFFLADMYYYGRGVSQDYAIAAYWFRRGAEQGDMMAQTYLAEMYDNGQGVPQDYSQAAAWYLKASEQGDFIAQFNLGEMYENGQGVPKNLMVAYALYRISALDKNVSGAAIINLQKLVEKMTTDQIKSAEALIVEISKPNNLSQYIGIYLKACEASG